MPTSAGGMVVVAAFLRRLFFGLEDRSGAFAVNPRNKHSSEHRVALKSKMRGFHLGFPLSANQILGIHFDITYEDNRNTRTDKIARYRFWVGPDGFCVMLGLALGDGLRKEGQGDSVRRALVGWFLAGQRSLGLRHLDITSEVELLNENAWTCQAVGGEACV